MDEMYKDIYKKLMTLQWLLRRYQMMNCKEHKIEMKDREEFLHYLRFSQRLRRKIWHIS